MFFFANRVKTIVKTIIVITKKKKMGRKTSRIGDLLQQTKQTVKKRINAVRIKRIE